MHEVLYVLLGFTVTFSIFTMAIVVYSKKVMDNLAKEKKRSNTLEDIAKSRGWRHCGICGKLYEPLNDEDYQPELDICRDCLWKVHYESTFKDDGSRK